MASNVRYQMPPMLRLAVDFGPLVIFFLVNALAPGSALQRGLAATTTFMIAISIAIIFSWWKTRHISPMLWMSGMMVLVFGSLTLYLQDLNFIQLKPSIYYVTLAIALGYGLMSGKPLLQMLLGEAYPGLSERGWRILTLNWSLFFGALAVANAFVWWKFSYDFWNWFKLWAVIPATFLFGALNIPMLLKHGLQLEKPEDAPVPPLE